jgi:hypothetical protein
MPGHTDDLAYLTIVAEPRGMTWDDFLWLLAEATGLDRLTVQQRLAKMPPQILCRCEAGRGLDLANHLRGRGVDAISLTASRLEALGAPMLVKFMEAAAGGYQIDIWRGPSTFLPTSTIQTIIRASVHSETRRRRPDLNAGARLAGRTAGYGIMRVPYRLGDADEARPGTGSDTSVHRKASELIDVHTNNGLWFRISGDKFAWHVLGPQRTQGDRVNADRLAQRLASEAPHAIFDEFYKLFKAPPGSFAKGKDVVAYGSQHAQGLGTFDLYSRWACLVYRHISGIG